MISAEPVESADPVDRAFRALSDPIRRRAVELLAAAPLRSGELAGSLGVSPPAMSKHLRVLRRSGLVDERSDQFDARVRIYSLRSAALSDLREWMERAEKGWAAQLDSLKNHVECSTEGGDDA